MKNMFGVPFVITLLILASSSSSIKNDNNHDMSAVPSLPDPAQFKKDNGTKWTIQYVGDIQFTGKLQQEKLGGDKCRSSVLGGRVIWNCGDMECSGDWRVCGFSMGPAFYGTNSVMTVNTTGIQYVQDNNFVTAWSGDPPPQAPFTDWGMDTTNIAPINATHGVAYAWEIWRGGSNNYSDRGNAVASITLGPNKPMSRRVGPLLTGPNAIQLGLIAILRDGDYIYIYSLGGPSNIIVGRVIASDDVFDASKYQFLEYKSSSVWSGGIPNSSTTKFGMTTANTSGKFGCAVYGSVIYNNYLKKYTIICSIFLSFVNMYVSDTPWGPWSAEYSLLGGWTGYGSMAHPEFSPGGSQKEIYFSQGPNQAFNMFKITFNY